MRILFLSHYFPPEVNAPASRTFEHCRAWVEAGHEVTVVTCAPNHPRGELYKGYRNRLWQEETVEGIRVIRLWTLIAANQGFLLRTLNYLSFMFSCLAVTFRFPQADVVVSTSPQFFNGLAGYFVSRLRHMPWILEIRDLWPESIVAVGAIRSRAVIRVLEWLEHFAYRKADLIVAVTDAFKAHMVSRGIKASKIEVIKNGANLALYRPVDGRNAELRRSLQIGDRFVAAYVGTHGMAHHLETLLEAAALLRERTDIAILMVGEGAERDRLVALRDQMGLSNVIMLPQQPKEAVPGLWQLADVSLVVLQRSALFRTVIPSKIFESLAMERPVVLGVEGESAELIAQAGGGVSFEPENARALADTLIALADDPERLREMAVRGREFVMQHFDREVLAQRFAREMQSLIETEADTVPVLRRSGEANA